MPTLSIVMSVFNAADTLRPAIDSILSQGFEDFQFIILDDGSSDSTPDILDAYDDPRLHIVHNKTNAGLTARLNEGLALCTAEIVARMDADDIAYPDRLGRQYEALLSDPDLIAVFSHAEIIDVAGRVTAVHRVDFGDKTALQFLQDRGNVLVHSSAMMRKGAILALGGYDDDLRTRQDYDLWMKCLEAGHRIDILPELLLQLRIHDKSISANGRRNWQLNCVVAARSVLREAADDPLPGIEALMTRAETLPAIRHYVDVVHAKRQLRMAKSWHRLGVAMTLLRTQGIRTLIAAARPISMVEARQALVEAAQNEDI